MKHLVITALILLAGIQASALSLFRSGEFKLMDNGKAVCEIVIPANAPDNERFAGKELARGLGLVAGGKAPAVVTAKTGKAYPVSFAVTKDKKIIRDGFRLNVTKKGTVIEYNTSVGALYGAYEILKRYAGMIWVLPGDDGEYYTKKPTIAIPEQQSIHNPFRRIRSGNNLGLSREGRLWMVRNYMNVPCSRDVLKNNREYRELGAKVFEGYHCFSKLLADETSWPRINQKLDAMFREHPEYFPLINGKRVNLRGPHGFSDKQPCTSNPDVIRIMRANLEKAIRERVLPDGMYILYNNDGTAWCQCANCRKQDSKEDIENNWVTHRYWTFIRNLTDGLIEKYPTVVFDGSPYQNFQNVPSDRTLVPKNILIEVSFNRACWRHNIDDPNCFTNPDYLKRYNDWAKMGNPMSSWEQITTSGSTFTPIEFTVKNRLEYYKKINCEMFPELNAPYCNVPRWDRMTKDMWFSIWQSVYFIGNAQWDKNFDYDKAYERINALYYGKAWQGGMKELRALLVKTFSETVGCAGHGHGTPLGKMLEKPGVHQKILDLFAKAEKSAASDPDPRALMHVRRDHELFHLTWEKSYDLYKTNFREINAYRKTGKIVIDGNLNEPDWKNADIISRFNNERTHKPLPENLQSYARIVYEPDYIYFAVECMEPHPEKMVSNITRHDANVWEDNTFEIFINTPDMGDGYYQLIFNAKGVCFDQVVKAGVPGDRKFESHCEFKTKVLKDRWVLEGRIPTDALGEKCFDGQIWKVNMERSRVLSDGTRTPCNLSVTQGKSVTVFQNVNFVKSRKIDSYTASVMDTRSFPNGSFNELDKASNNSNLKTWKVINGIAPKGWMFGGPNPGNRTIELVLHPGSTKDYYLKASGGGFIFQRYKGDKKNVRYSFRAKGKGKVLVLALQEIRRKGQKPKGLPAYGFGTIDVDSDAWKTYKFEYHSNDPDMDLCPGFCVKEGTVCFDDVMVMPYVPKTK